MKNMRWTVCVGASGFEVSDYGDVRRAGTVKRIKGYITCDGYIAYSLTCDDGVRREMMAHTLVAEAFIEPRPSPKMQVAHSNGSRLFNHPDNLRWATSLSNHDDRRKHNTGPSGERNPRAKISETDVIFIRSEYREIKSAGKDRSVTELENKYQLHRATIVNIAMGRTWSHIPMDAI